MVHRKPLRCSFCGRSENEVSKLVAGAKAYICDECVAIVTNIMRESAEQPVEEGGPAPNGDE